MKLQRVVDCTQSGQHVDVPAVVGQPTNPITSDEYGVPWHHNDNACALCCPHDSAFAAAICCVSALCLPVWLSSCKDVQYREEAAIYLCDQPYAHVSGHRWLCVNPCLRMENYSRSARSLHLLQHCRGNERLVCNSPVLQFGLNGQPR